MDIAALSTSLSQMKLSQEIGVSVLEVVMDSSQSQMTDMIQILAANTKVMEQSITPNLGGNIDIRL
ncbi:YjfB family protein [Tissierella sp.]|uniref:YjfB family protein n=1 Tax=Tissierella sp. TaxID=41274 RepID=UPI002866BB0C|nr:YjfB family protein [Tissierella sp.]MDR7856907.1 YjfB family protein [Tissierella sp.]